MGRHSAPDDEDDVVEVPSAVLTEDAPVRGRHSRRSDESATQVITLPQQAMEAPTGPVWGGQSQSVDTRPVDSGAADSPIAAAPVAEAPAVEDGLFPGGFTAETAAPTSPAKPKRPRAGSADLALLRQHPDVRARCIAAVLAPFVVYFAAQIAMGSSGRQMLLFLFIPLILAGVLVGALLDAGHKRHGTPAPSRLRTGPKPVDQGARDWQRLPEHWHETVTWPRGSRDGQGVSPGPDDQRPS